MFPAKAAKLASDGPEQPGWASFAEGTANANASRSLMLAQRVDSCVPRFPESAGIQVEN